MTAITRLSLTAVPGSALLAGGVNHTSVYLAAHSDQGWGSVTWGEQPWHNYNWFDMAQPAGSFLETDTDARLYNQNLRQLFSDADAVLYLPANGSDGQTTIEDHSEQEHTVTPAGGFQLSSTKTKFNLATSGRFAGSGDKLTLTDHANWNFGSGDFTVDFWFLFDAGTLTTTTFYSQQADASNLIEIVLNGSTLQFTITDTAVNEITLSGAVTVTLDAWHHVAVTRSGNDWRLFFNGVQADSVTKSYIAPDLMAGAEISGYNATITNAYLADFRILKGRADWTGAFTPPTNAHGSAYVRQWQVAFADVAACGAQGPLSETLEIFGVDAAGQLALSTTEAAENFRAKTKSGGEFELIWDLVDEVQEDPPVSFKVYHYNGATWDLLVTKTYSRSRRGYRHATTGYTHNVAQTFKVTTVRTIGAQSVESNGLQLTATPDAQGPPAIATVSATT